MDQPFRIIKTSYIWLQIITHTGAWLPAVYLTGAYLTGNLTVNPIQELTRYTGYTALVLLVLSLVCTPANTLFGWRQAIKIRRPLGLYAFGYAFAHFLTFAGLDYRFDISLLLDAIFEKPFILVGLAALIILISLAVTSFQWWMKRLGKNWKRLHQLIYIAAPLVLIHYAWSQKGDLSRLQGDILQPLVFSLVIGILLILRIPAIRRQAARLRHTAFKHPPDEPEKEQPWRAKKNPSSHESRSTQ